MGINRAIINDNAQMQTLFQLLRSTVMQGSQPPQRFVYPKGGMQDAWDSVAGKRSESLEEQSSRVKELRWSTLENKSRSCTSRKRKDLNVRKSFGQSIDQACRQLNQPSSKLSYLGLLLFNVMVKEEA